MKTSSQPHLLRYLLLALVSVMLGSGWFYTKVYSQAVPAQQHDESLTIFGEPPDQAIVDELYDFTPAIIDPLNGSLTFTVTNLPPWATFDPATGKLSGTPTVEDVGLHPAIVIGVTNGVESASLPTFEINVAANAEAFNEEPIFDNPEPPTTAAVGELYYYDPGLYDPEGTPLTVSAANLPAWLKLDPVTGIISGTPSAGDVGVDVGIVLTATEASGVKAAAVLAAAPNVVDNALPPIQVDNPNLPYSPSSLLFCGLTTDTLTPKNQTIKIKQSFDGNAGYEAFIGTMTWDIELRADSFDVGEGTQASITVSPLPKGPLFTNGLNERSIKFSLNGQNYTVPVKVFVGSTCSDGQVPGPSLQLSRSKLEYGVFLGDPATSKPLKIESTYGVLRWTAEADQDWVQLSAQNGQTPQTININVDASQFTTPGQHTAQVTITDQNNNTKEVAIILNVGKSKTESEIDLTALEVTQGMQNLLNSMPLVVDRVAYVRAHVRSNTGKPISGVKAKLEVRRGNTLLGTLTPENEGGAITVNPTPDRGQLNDSFYFELKSGWTISGTVTVKLVGDNQTIGCADLIDTPNDCQATAKFDRVMPTVPIRFYRASFPGILSQNPRRDGTVEASVSDVEWARDVLMAYYPISNIDFRQQVSYYANTADAQANGLTRAETAYKAGGKDIHYYSLNRKNAGDSCCAGAGGKFIAASEVKQRQGAATIAQEYEHTFYNHAACGEIGNTKEPRFPAYVHDRISEATSGPEAYYGFDRFLTDNEQRIYPPTTKSVMSYCDPTWVSEWEYRDLLNRISAIQYGDLGAMGAAQAGAQTNVLLVRGLINSASSATIQSVTSGVINGNITVPLTGTYTLRLEKANGELLASYPFDADPIDPHEVQPQTFGVLLPYKVDPAVLKKIVLLRNGVVELASKTGSANAPAAAAQITDDTTTGLLTLTFTSTDADNDSLTHDVAYSPDNGQTWQTVTEDWPASVLVIDTNDLPGSKSNPKLRIFAHDGFYSAQTEIALSNPVPNHRPQAFIITPLDAINPASEDESIVLEGAGWDQEDGELSGASLIWHSDQDGVLGTGKTLTIAADQLSTGQNTIWLEAVDSAGLSSVVSSTPSAITAAHTSQVDHAEPVTTNAADAESVLGAPLATFSIARDRPYVPPQLTVDPINVVVTAGQSTTATVAIRNTGDDVINWNVQPNTLPTWATFSQNSGQTPSALVLTVNASALSDGVYSGTLTFQSLDSVDTELTVPYQVMVQTPSSVQALTVNKAGNGDGVVTSDPLRLDCGVDCSAEFSTGSTVTLTATADDGSVFNGWSGACTGSSTICQVTMNDVKNVTATFTLSPTSSNQSIYLPLVQK